MSHLILHAGIPKTGTDTIQNTLSRNAWDTLLAARNICYLKHRSIDNNHSRYFNALCGRPEWASTAAHNRNVASFTEALHAIKAGTPNKAILISAESVSAIAGSEENLAHVVNFIARFFSDVAIIVYVREPLSYMCSRIQQALKSGYPLSHAMNNVVTNADHTIWLQNLRALFGTSKVTIRSFDPAILIDGEIVTDFCLGALAIPDSTPLRRRIDSRTEHNYSVPRELMELLLSLYRHKSISPQNMPDRFNQGISNRRWAGNRFDVTFFSKQDRRRLVAAADDARDRIRNYLGYDCFPSYRPVDTDALNRRSMPREASTFRQYIAQLRQTLHDFGDTQNIERTWYSNDKGMKTLDDARSEAYRLLDRFHELCKRSE